MYLPANIAKHLRLLFTAITLLFVVGLNNREVTSFAIAPANSTEQQVDKAAADQHGTVKQKVSFEATCAGIVLPPASLLPTFWQIDIPQPVQVSLSKSYSGSLATAIFRRLLSTAISPNAP